MNNLTTIPDEPQKSANDGILAVIARAASDPSVDIDKFERLLALQERVNAQQAKQEFDAAMNKAQKEMGPVIARRKNSQTGSNYADEDAIDAIARPIYTAHGFSLSFNTGEAKKAEDIKIICECAHAGGFTKHYEVDMPADGKGAKGGDVMTRTHAAGSAMQYGKRYLLRMIFNIVIAKDDDGNGASGTRFINEEKQATLREWMETTGTTEKALLSLYGGNSVAEIQEKDYLKFLSALKQKAKLQAAETAKKPAEPKA